MSFEDRIKLEELYKYEESLKNRIWNEAIEAAVIKADYYSYEASVNIRKLKKDVTD